MGVVYKATCPKCDYSARFCLGGGMMAVNLMNSLRVLPIEEQDRIKDLEKSEKIASFSVENRLVRCKQCGDLSAPTIINIEQHNGEKLLFGNTCGSCGGDVSIYEGSNKVEAEVMCPKCKETSLELIAAGFWD